MQLSYGGGCMDLPEEEEEADWLCPEPGGRGSHTAPGRVSSTTLGAQSGHNKTLPSGSTAHRVIVHTDLDCFYAQVEMIHNPELRDKPLGVQQKYLVVTCNYEARRLGIQKLMSVRDAKEKCRELVLVNGEDLTQYREMSYKVTAVNLHDVMHIRLIIGSQIAAEMREAMYNRLGLTGCAGVASNKLLSKLVSGTFKPNQQTVLLPESCQDLVGSLDHISKVPGIGYKTTKRLELLGLSSVRDLQTFSPVILAKELGVSMAQHIQKLSYGDDHSPVASSGPPQSLSDEDSFKKCSSEVEVKKKIEELLANLLDRISKDGRKPHTIRLTIRKFSSTNKWFSRESRQCPIPPHVIQKFGTGNSDIVAPLVGILMKLFRKMIKLEMPFHLTLLSVCFSNLKALPTLTKGSIGFYLTQSSPPSSSGKKMDDVPQVQVNSCSFVPDGRIRNTGTRESSLETKSCAEEPGIPVCPIHLFPAGIDQEVFSQLPEDIKEEIISDTSGQRIHTKHVLSQPLPFSKGALPFFAQEEMHTTPDSRRADHSISSLICSEHFQSTSELETAMIHRPNPNCSLSLQDPHEYPESALIDNCMEQVPKESLNFNSTDSIVLNLQSQHFLQPHSSDRQEQPIGAAFQDKGPREQASGEGRIVFPPTVDPDIFSELPAEMQKELLAEWKNLKPVSKMHQNKPSEKLKTNKGKKNVVLCSSQSNSLLRYFKPK
ncbi:DNA polymerase iota isoform X3 [Gopherus flavomarginatus]|uniref:DNA polymerase iota isoform X3 n=1 Tax=Gopherus flavomarginatus TaxID=286002 RepID=UPI0021CBF23F|nr:DNA polymerase iota isoform X3 [Gopherus flavomarginatus]